MSNSNVLVENLIKIDLLDDYWNIQKECRREFYNLRSLKIRIDNYRLVVKNNRSKDEIENIQKNWLELSKRAEILLNEFELHDNKLKIKNQNLNEENINGIIDEVAIDKKVDELNYEVDIIEILAHLREAIILRSNINMLQKEILTRLIEEQEYLDGVLVDDEIMGMWIQYTNDQLIKTGLNHSPDEDRIDTYQIDINSKSIRKEFINSTSIKLPVYEKCRNVDSELKRLRNRFKEAFDLQIKICEIKDKNKKEEIQEKRNIEQHKFNKMVTIATIVSTIICLIDLCIVIWENFVSK